MWARPFRGVFPVAPTIFDDRGELDLEGQRRCIDFMIDAGSQGICILANFSEQFTLTDDERERIMRGVLDHVAARVPVIVTTTHFSSRVCAERSRRAQSLGAAMVMVMPPYHGATIRATEAAIYDFFRLASDAIDIPIM
ncbi:MAG: dihydrodipicolinate synthase family protein, partial [bacterium]